MDKMTRCLKWVGKMVILVAIGFSMVCISHVIYLKNFTQEAQDAYIQDMYQHILAQTGQVQDALPLIIDDSDTVNAYNDGTKIVIYRGLIDQAHSWDEVALILSHEIAHGMLWHLRMDASKLSENDIAVLEGNADKMGAIYAIKAGWDVCKGREVFKYWREEYGNALGQTHPDYSYRFDELDINCSK